MYHNFSTFLFSLFLCRLLWSMCTGCCSAKKRSSLRWFLPCQMDGGSSRWEIPSHSSPTCVHSWTAVCDFRLWLVVPACQCRLGTGTEVWISADCVPWGEREGVISNPPRPLWRGVSHRQSPVSSCQMLHDPSGPVIVLFWSVSVDIIALFTAWKVIIVGVDSFKLSFYFTFKRRKDSHVFLFELKNHKADFTKKKNL